MYRIGSGPAPHNPADWAEPLPGGFYPPSHLHGHTALRLDGMNQMAAWRCPFPQLTNLASVETGAIDSELLECQDVFRGGLEPPILAKLALVIPAMLLQGHTGFFDPHSPELAALVHSIKRSAA